MKRRALLFAGGAWLAQAAAPSFSQPAKLRRIAFVNPGSHAGFRTHFEAFRNALKELGYVEGRDISIEASWADDDTARLTKLAAEVVESNPDVIVTATSAGIAAFKKATSSIPIVFATAGNPVEQGFVSSLHSPGGNITGVLVYVALTPKLVEIAREALPNAGRLALLLHDADPAHKLMLEGFEASAQRFRFEPTIVHIGSAVDLDRAFTDLAERKAEVAIVPSLQFFGSHHKQLAERALKARLPLVSSITRLAETGALLSYGTRTEENYPRAASLVDKILRGAKPADLPVEQPQRFELVVNRKTAKAIGVTLSPVTMLRADRIID
jgi:putative ABC transport system substrate-binding protein